MGNSEIKSELAVESLSTVLKTARLANNISIDYIVSETRISKLVLEQIESENPKNLPEPVFLKGFLKAYSRIVGLDPNEIIKLYQAQYGIKEDSSYANTDMRLASTGVAYGKKNYTLPFIIAIVVFVFFGTMLLNYNKTDSDTDQSVLKTDIETVDEEAGKNEKQIVEYKLEVECVEDTTLKISTDGEQVAEYNLKAEEHLELKAKENFNILITNTCGVTLFLNDKVIDVPGKCGQTANMHLP